MTICSCTFLIDVKFESSPVERRSLSNCSSIRWFESQDDTQPPKYISWCLWSGDSLQLQRCQLGWENSVRVGKEKEGVYLVLLRFNIRWQLTAPGYPHSQNTETDIDDFLLWPLSHSHSKQRLILSQVITNHRVQEFFWGEVVLINEGFQLVSSRDKVMGLPVRSSVCHLWFHSLAILISVFVDDASWAMGASLRGDYLFNVRRLGYGKLWRNNARKLSGSVGLYSIFTFVTQSLTRV